MALEALADTRVVVVNGARQVGKSTLAQLIVDRSPGSRALYLDDPVTLAAAEEDPVGFVRHDGLLLIDEIQRVPGLLLPIKREVDRNPRPGRYLLTGSARASGRDAAAARCHCGAHGELGRRAGHRRRGGYAQADAVALP